MNHKKPSLSYNGLTLILEHPSRFDQKANSLLTANGGCFFNEVCLAPEYNLYQCDIRTPDCVEPLMDRTKVVMLLGDAALKILPQIADNKIGEVQGSVYMHNNVYYIPAFYPQDAVDIQDYEAERNEFKIKEILDKSSIAEKRRHGVTARSNYKFWLRKAVNKAKYALKNGYFPAPIIPEVKYHIYPNASDLIEVMDSYIDEAMFLDLETDQKHNIYCSGLSFGTSPDVYVFPWLDFKYNWPYEKLPQIIFAFKNAIKRNIAVAHNGAAFDFQVLARKYRIPVKKAQDTMLMHHRCYMSIEKSLGHCTSLWTNEPFHKDEGGGGYNSVEQMHDMMKYCGKDVYTMKLIYYAILEFAKKVPGLMDSINQVNDAIVPYLCMTLEGIRFNEELQKKVMFENDRLMEQYIRFINILVGDKALKILNKSNKTSLAASNKKCVTYFHEMLGYPVVARGKENAKGQRNPSLGKEAIFKLKMQFDNPVLDFIIAYRELAKESGSLKFNPWKWKE